GLGVTPPDRKPKRPPPALSTDRGRPARDHNTSRTTHDTTEHEAQPRADRTTSRRQRSADADTRARDARADKTGGPGGEAKPLRAGSGGCTPRQKTETPPARALRGQGAPRRGGAGNRTRALRRFARASPCAVRFASTRIHRSRGQAGVTIPVAV